MESYGSDEVMLPRRALEVLLEAAGSEPAALVAAGRHVGEALAARLSAVSPAEELTSDEFWAAVSAELAARGLGQVECEPAGETLRVRREPATGDGEGTGTPPPEAWLVEGLLEGMLGAVVGEPVGALWAGGSEPDEAGTWLAGSPSFLRIVRGRLGRGLSLEAALEES